MSLCKFCGVPFDWGIEGDKYVPLVPLGEHDELPRNFQDENGVLRASHRLICVNRGGPTVRVNRLAVAVQPENIIKTRRLRKGQTDQTVTTERLTIGQHVDRVLERKAARKAARLLRVKQKKDAGEKDEA